MKAFKYKLYITRRTKHLDRQIQIASNVYNHCIALHKRYYRLTGKHLNAYRLVNHVTRLKRRRKYLWWRGLNAQACQNVVLRIDKAYRLFFRNMAAGIKTSPPGFKKATRYRSVTFPQTGYKLLGGNHIKIRDKIYGYHKEREIQGDVKTVTVKRDTLGDYFICIATEYVEPERFKTTTGKIAGFDFGLKMFLTSNSGLQIESPLFFKQNRTELRKASRGLSSKMRGSNNRVKSRMAVARIHRKIANQRRDWFFKLGKQLAQDYDQLFFEDLNLRGMVKLWGRKVSDLSFGEFIRTLEFQAQKYGCSVVKVDRWFPSSKLCHICDHKNSGLQLADRQWVCPNCGAVLDRDVNAAKNITREGVSSHRLEGRSPHLCGILCKTLGSRVAEDSGVHHE